ncbi:prepilin peptidase [Idiomarina xiamenensis]|nr:A24 family peptidase [Idiomarina xiamenensis]
MGLLLGSFLNVVIARLPRQLQQQWRHECQLLLQLPTTEDQQLTIVKPRSQCPHCQHSIAWYDNIPLLSWLYLRGRCRHCQARISYRYPLVECCYGIIFAALAWHHGASLALVVYGIAAALLLCLIFIDLQHYLLPDPLTLPLLWLGLLWALLGGPLDITSAVIGAMAGYLSLWSVYWLFKLLTGKEGMGYGDFKLLAAIGAFCGWQALPVVVVSSAVLGIIYALLARLSGHLQRGQAIPFGPFLAVAGVLSFYYAQTWLQLYWQWLGL